MRISFIARFYCPKFLLRNGISTEHNIWLAVKSNYRAYCNNFTRGKNNLIFRKVQENFYYNLFPVQPFPMYIFHRWLYRVDPPRVFAISPRGSGFPLPAILFSHYERLHYISTSDIHGYLFIRKSGSIWLIGSSTITSSCRFKAKYIILRERAVEKK